MSTATLLQRPVVTPALRLMKMRRLHDESERVHLNLCPAVIAFIRARGAFVRRIRVCCIRLPGLDGARRWEMGMRMGAR